MLLADATTILSTHKDTKLLYEQANGKLKKLQNWHNFNKLSININKTNYILFPMKKNYKNSERILNSAKIKKSTLNFFWGVYVDCKLT